VESSLSHGCGVSAAMDSDSTDVVVNPLSVLPVSGNGGAGLNGGWSSLLSGQTSVTSSSTAVAPAISAVSVTSNAGAVSMVPTFSNRVLVRSSPYSVPYFSIAHFPFQFTPRNICSSPYR